MADNVYNLKFTLSNGDVIDAGQITAPQGPKGDKGDSATIDANTLLALLLGSNGIAIAKNTAGDKVEVKIGDKFNVPSNVQFQSSGAYVGFYADNGEFGLKAITSSGEQTAQPFIKGEYTANNTFNFIVQSPAGSSGVTIDNASITRWDLPGNYRYTFLHQGNVKTLFGNQQSIYGSGNIDLYKHNLVITATATNVSALKALITFTSSSNTKIDSLTKLYTACSKFGEISASGYVTKAGKVCPIYSALCNSGDGIHFIEATLDDRTGLAWTAMTGVTIVDEVTTV